MPARSLGGLWLSCAVVSILAAQEPRKSQVLLVERLFHADSERLTIALRRGVVYLVELSGSGTLIVEPERRARAPFFVPIGDSTIQPRRFELHAFVNAPHNVHLADLVSGDSTLLRIYADTAETQRITQKRDRAATVGLSLAGGTHSGYRLDPTGGVNPRGGVDLDACLLLEVGDRFGSCVGLNRQSFPDAHYIGSWLFLEERVRLISRNWLGSRTTDVGAVLRYSRGAHIGPRLLDPVWLGAGIQVTQRFSSEGRRRGWRAFLGWQHGRLGGAPETEFLYSDRFGVGLIWAP